MHFTSATTFRQPAPHDAAGKWVQTRALGMNPDVKVALLWVVIVVFFFGVAGLLVLL